MNVRNRLPARPTTLLAVFSSAGWLSLGAQVDHSNAIPGDCLTAEPFAYCGMLWDLGALFRSVEVALIATAVCLVAAAAVHVESTRRGD